jgi:4'-phosphopantetheinyl transferase
MLSPSLSPPPLDLELPADEIHVWRASLDQPVPRFQRLKQLLSPDESMRAEQFHFEQDRKRFIACHGILRTILGRYLNVDPNRLQFCNGKNGKPALAHEFDNGSIHFNLSHSNEIVLYGFARDQQMGVDIERIRNISEMDQITKRFFSKTENEILRNLPDNQKKEAFFNCWTRKEAFIKAIGEGLSYPLNKFVVSLVPGEPARLLRIEGDSKAASRWFIQELNPAPGFAAAFAVEGRRRQLRFWQWLP